MIFIKTFFMRFKTKPLFSKQINYWEYEQVNLT
jgi:hypothetical protein